MSKHKYLQGFILEINKIFEYRMGFYIRLLRPIIKILVLVSIWSAVFAATNKQTIAGYGTVEFALYLIIVTFISSSLFAWKIGTTVTDDIRIGQLTTLITKPVSYMKLIFSRMAAHMTMTGIYSFAVFFIGAITIHYTLGYQLLPEQATLIVPFIVSLILSYILAFCYYFIIACTAFWWGETWSILGVAITIQTFLSGEIIPLHISPMLMTFANFFPFKSMIYTPAAIYLGEVSWNTIGMHILGQAGWVIALILFARFILKRGIRKFEAQGG